MNMIFFFFFKISSLEWIQRRRFTNHIIRQDLDKDTQKDRSKYHDYLKEDFFMSILRWHGCAVVVENECLELCMSKHTYSLGRDAEFSREPTETTRNSSLYYEIRESTNIKLFISAFLSPPF